MSSVTHMIEEINEMTTLGLVCPLHAANAVLYVTEVADTTEIMEYEDMRISDAVDLILDLVSVPSRLKVLNNKVNWS